MSDTINLTVKPAPQSKGSPKSYVLIVVNNEEYLAPSTEVEESSHELLIRWREQKVTESELYDLRFLLGMEQYVKEVDRGNPYYGLWDSKNELPQMIDVVYVIPGSHGS